MTKPLFNFLVFLLYMLIPLTTANAQTGKGLVFDGKSQFVQCPATGFPTGTAARTLEFWVRAVPNTDGKSHPVISWGRAASNGSTFGVYARYVNNRYSLCFWGHNQDIQPIAALPDDQWHFVALTYDGKQLRSFLNGELKATNTIALNTNPGPMYIGTRDGSPDFFQGVVRDIAVWNQVRSQDQIQKDMVPWPTITGNENGLVAYFGLNEGKGNTFSDKKNVISGAINGKATWSKPITSNPDPINEGIWFVIQNKADLDNDTEKTARRMAFYTKDSETAWGSIPLSGDCDAFLWRIVLQDGEYRIVNKKMGMTKALSVHSGKRYAYMNDYGVYEAQNWTVQQANLNDWGTNVYTMSNAYVPNEALVLEGTEVKFAPKVAGQTKQAWVFQPMELATGYHIPVSAAANGPMTQELSMAYGFKVYASNTVRDWSVLNGHLIWKNMLNALYNTDAIAALNGQNYTRKELQIISRFDQNRIVAKYPMDMANGQLIFDEKWFTDYRGGSGNDPNRKLSSTTVSEEMMCRRGVFSRGYKDKSVREFDQTIHEFGHALDKTCGMNGENFPDPTLYGSRVEGIAAAVQTWFNNNNSYDVFARTRSQQKTQQPNHYNRLKQFFRESNSWMPVRWLRDQPDGRVELKDGETLQAGEWIFSSPPYSPNGTYAVLQDDGNFTVNNNDDNGFKWGSFNNINVALNKVKTLKMENGILRMKDAGGNNVYSSNNNPAPGARLVIAEPLPGKPNSWIRIVDATGDNLIWSPQ